MQNGAINDCKANKDPIEFGKDRRLVSMLIVTKLVREENSDKSVQRNQELELLEEACWSYFTD